MFANAMEASWLQNMAMAKGMVRICMNDTANGCRLGKEKENEEEKTKQRRAAETPPATAAYDALIGWEQDALDDEVEAERLRVDLLRQVHDRALACEIMSVPDEEWLQTGNNLHRPFGEGSSLSSSNGQNFQFKVYVKGLVERGAGGIGVAICDGNDGLLFELSKGLSGKDQDKELVDFKALIEGLDAAVMLDLKRITVVTDNPLLCQHITGENTQTIKTAVTLSSQIQLLRKFTKCHPSLVASNANKAVKLARNAIAFQVNRSAGSSNGKNLTEQCTICLEDTYVDRMFLNTSCRHSYCFLCMSKHFQFKLLQGRLPKCPHENCTTELMFVYYVIKYCASMMKISPKVIYSNEKIFWKSFPFRSTMFPADVDMSSAILVEPNGETRRQPASVRSGTSAISYTTKIDSNLDDCIVV
ncbi:hypothetical protein SASPL_119801 [Salvia splendens]|uniref:RING-type domain-containing protein n=1 Tax=Salvia splendens TaxID=180675 RepID=A0A8X8ZTF3_SALSN|nr:hypothetical protein SASPL_119801 [Salvia splendens]